MKKIIIIIFLCLTSEIYSQVSLNTNVDTTKNGVAQSFFSQSDTSKLINEQKIFDRESIYVELIGNTFSFLSVNFEHVFIDNFLFGENKISSLSFRMGYGTGFIENEGLVFMMNWQIGEILKFEFGFGLLYTFGEAKDTWGDSYLGRTENNFLYTFTLGYKYHFNSEGLLFRIGFTPIISLEGIFQPSFGLSGGITF